MEGCPRSLMLSVDLKESFPTEFSTLLKSYIREHYHEDPDSYKNECSQLEQLRTASLYPANDHSGCSTLRRYYAQLQFLQSRFPMGEGGAVSVQFTWTDLYSEEPISLCDVRFEQAAILHNLAALHSQLGCHEDRTAEEGMKVACTHFQAAAGIFQHLKDHFASDAFFDMAGCLLQLYTTVMLGQAQECLLEKSILDGRKNSLIARISMQVHDYYHQALQFLELQGSSYMGNKKAKIWLKNLKIKCCHYLCVAYIHMSNNSDENQKFGEKVAYLKAASQKVTEAQKASKGQPERTVNLLQFVGDVVSNKLQGAVKDNDFIYHEAVPELDALPEIKAAPLVKPIPFQPCDPSVSGPDIFQRLIPMKAHTDASLYSEEKAVLLRRYVGSIEQKNQLLSKALADLHIDDLLEPEEYDTLPAGIQKTRDSMKKEVEALKDAENNIEELAKMGSKVEELCKSIDEMLQEDKQNERELEEQIGPITPPPERNSFVKDLEQCQESHKKASLTNSELIKVFTEHKHHLDLLAGPVEGLLAALPSLNIIDTPIDDGAVQQLRDLISKVDQMKSQRKQLEEDFRKQLAGDDITQQLVTREEGNKAMFFEVQLKKHDNMCALIQANLDAQEKILRMLTEANAKYAPTRQAVKETAHRRDEVVQMFVLSYETFLELKEKLSRGLRFYQSLEETLAKLEEKVKEYRGNRKNEMAKMEEMAKKAKKAKEKSKTPPARPVETKPEYLVHPAASSISASLTGQYPGALVMSNSGVRLEGSLPLPPGGPFQARNPGGVSPPRPHHAAAVRFYQPGAPVSRIVSGVSERQHQIPTVSGSQPILPDQSAPHLHGKPAFTPGLTVTGMPLSQVGSQGSIPAEQIIHSASRMSYPMPVGPPLMPRSQPGAQQGPPTSPYLAHQLPRQQHVPQLPAAGPGGTHELPSYDQAKHLPGSRQVEPGHPHQPFIPPQQNATQGQQPAPSQQHFPGQQVPPIKLNPQVQLGSQLQAPRPPHPPPPLRPQNLDQAFVPQRHPQPITSQQISQPPQSSPHPQQSWHSQKHPQQPGFPQQALPNPNQFQQPLLQPHQQLLQPSKLSQQFQQPPQQMQQPLQPQQQIQQPTNPHQQVQQPLKYPQQFHQPQQYQQHPLQQPLQPQQKFQQPLQSQQQLQQLSKASQEFQQFPKPAQLQQHTQPMQAAQVQKQFQPTQPQKQFQQQPPSHSQQQFQQPSHLQQPFQHPPHQFQQPLQGKQQAQSQTLQPKSQSEQRPQQQQQRPLQPQQNYEQPSHLQRPLQPEQHFPFQQPLSPFHATQQSSQLQNAPIYQPLHARQSGKTPPDGSQVLQDASQAQQMLQIGQVPQLPPKSQVPQQFTQSEKPRSWQRQASDPSRKPQQEVHPPQQQQLQPQQLPYTGYNASQQPVQHSTTSTHLGYPLQPQNQPWPKPTLPPKQPENQRLGVFPASGLPEVQHNSPLVSSSLQHPHLSQSMPHTDGIQEPAHYARRDSFENQQLVTGKQYQSGLKQAQRPSQGQQTTHGHGLPQQQGSISAQQPPAHSPLFSRQDSSGSNTKSPFYGPPPTSPGGLGLMGEDKTQGIQSRSPAWAGYSTNKIPASSLDSYYNKSKSYPPSTPLAGSETFSYGQEHGRGASAPVVVQGVRPSPTSLASSAYATSYTVSLAQAQLSQQQQMQQLQQQMLLQQQQLIIQQQELLRHQQQQQQHESDQGHLTQLFQQVLQQQKQLVEMEQKLKDKEGHEDHQEHEVGHSAEAHDSSVAVTGSFEKGKEMSHKDPDKRTELSRKSSDFSASWGAGISNDPHGKIGMDDVFDKLAKKQINEISGKSKHSIQDTNSSLVYVKGGSDDSRATYYQEFAQDLNSTKMVKGSEVNTPVHPEVKADKENENQKADSSKEGESYRIAEQDDKKMLEADSTTTETKVKEKVEEKVEDVRHSKEEDREKQRLQVEEQIQRIKELQKTCQQQVQKQQYLYEPGKMPELTPAPSVASEPKPPVEEPSKPSLYRQCGHYYETQNSSIGQEENNKCLSEEEYMQKLSYTVEMFDALVVSLEQKRKNSSFTGFIAEWKELEKMQEEDSAILSTYAASRNPSKNRYRDILPWDHSTVKLKTKDGGDYINASYIKNITPLSPDYVVTQGPIAATLGDFWLMVWEQKSRVIVMLTKEVEGNRLKCHQYWPIDEGHTVVYEPMRVTLKRLTHCAAWIERIMHVQHAESQETLVVCHVQFTGWPDYGVPHSPSDLLSFIAEVYNHHQQTGSHRPLVVHCSAGVGRAGTFCVIYTAIRELNGTGSIVNIKNLVRNFRKKRKFMVQKKEQYEFCYRTILFYANQFVHLEKAAFALKNSKGKSHDVHCAVDKMSDLSPSHGVKSTDVNFLGEIFDDQDSESEVEVCLNADIDNVMGEDLCPKSGKSISADDTKCDGQTARIDQECTNNRTSEVQADDLDREREREDCSSGKGVTGCEADEATEEEHGLLKKAELSNDVFTVDESRDKQNYDVINAEVEDLKTACRLESEGDEAVQRDVERTGDGEDGEANESDSNFVPRFELHHSRIEDETGVEDLSSEIPAEEQERNQALPEQQHNTRPEQGGDEEQGTRPQQRRDDQQHSTLPEQRRDDQQHSTAPEQRRDDQQHNTRPEQLRDDQQHTTRPEQRRDDQQHSTQREQRRDPPEREEGEQDEEGLLRSEQSKQSEPRAVEESSMQPQDCRPKIIDETGEQEVRDNHTHCDQRNSQEQHEDQSRKTEREDQQSEEKQPQQAEETSARQQQEITTELEDLNAQEREQQVDQPKPNGTLLTTNIDDCHQENKDAKDEEEKSS